MGNRGSAGVSDEELLDDLDDAIDAISGIERADDFRESIQEKADSIREWYDKHGELTDAQRKAVENMTAGARRWIRE